MGLGRRGGYIISVAEVLGWNNVLLDMGSRAAIDFWARDLRDGLGRWIEACEAIVRQEGILTTT